MTRKVVVCDTDFLSSFLCVDRFDIILKTISGAILIPQIVYDELKRIESSSNKKLKWIVGKLDDEIKKKSVQIVDFGIGSPEFQEFKKLTSPPMPIGKGEAMAIAFAKSNNGILASNNLKDIKRFVTAGDILNITSDDLLCLFYITYREEITPDEIESIREKMRLFGRRISPDSFYELLSKFHLEKSHYSEKK
ncbi:MAG TPA: hypothetical protein ENN05_05730 [Deltaproteobacteria bacterium]|nr:hypothetical protein [Deltaproteobacteria bacterium]